MGFQWQKKLCFKKLKGSLKVTRFSFKTQWVSQSLVCSSFLTFFVKFGFSPELEIFQSKYWVCLLLYFPKFFPAQQNFTSKYWVCLLFSVLNHSLWRIFLKEPISYIGLKNLLAWHLPDYLSKAQKAEVLLTHQIRKLSDELFPGCWHESG